MKISRNNPDKIAKQIVSSEVRAADPEIVIGAAVRASNGMVVRGYRHVDAICTLQGMPGYEDESPRGADQGFITLSNRFVDRAEAYRLHFPNRVEPGELQSDDL
jgi:hypothetical protein